MHNKDKNLPAETQSNELCYYNNERVVSTSTLCANLKVVETENNIYLVSTNGKNIVMHTDGSFITSSKGYNVILGKEVHLNPSIKASIDSVEEIKQELDTQREERLKELENNS